MLSSWSSSRPERSFFSTGLVDTNGLVMLPLPDPLGTPASFDLGVSVEILLIDLLHVVSGSSLLHQYLPDIAPLFPQKHMGSELDSSRSFQILERLKSVINF